MLCIVKLRVLKAVLDSKFKINGKSEKLPTHPDIPTDGATPFRIFWASVMKYRPIYFEKEENPESIKFEKIMVKTYSKFNVECKYKGIDSENSEINHYMFNTILRDMKFYVSKFKNAVLYYDLLFNYPDASVNRFVDEKASLKRA